MSDDNQENAEKEIKIDPHRDERGRWKKGKPGGPGRPRGHLDFMTICRRMAKEEGVDLDVLVWATAKRLFADAIRGDSTSAKAALDRTCGPILRDQINVGVAVGDRVDEELEKLGPPVPSDADLGRDIARLAEIAVEQGLLPEKATGQPSVPNGGATSGRGKTNGTNGSK